MTKSLEEDLKNITKLQPAISEKDGLEKKEIKDPFEGYCNNSDMQYGMN